jgi:phenylalanyl-tRNA synthetase beta chain
VTLPYLVAGRSAAVSVGDTRVAVLGLVAPPLVEARDLPATDEIYAAEFDLEAIDRLVSGDDIQVEALPRFPSIVRDISIVVDEALPSDRVRATIRSAGPETLARVREFDRYKGKGIPEGRCSLSLRLTFRSPDRTLTDAEVQQAMERIVGALSREHQAVQR